MGREQFTPGPWAVTFDGMGVYSKTRTEWRVADAAPPGSCVTHVRANARLIAAAPSLYAALEGAIGALQFSRDYHNDLSNAEQAFAQDKLDAATQALRLARGETL